MKKWMLMASLLFPLLAHASADVDAFKAQVFKQALMHRSSFTGPYQHQLDSLIAEPYFQTNSKTPNIILTGGPRMGKTFFFLHLMPAAAQAKKKVYWIRLPISPWEPSYSKTLHAHRMASVLAWLNKSWEIDAAIKADVLVIDNFLRMLSGNRPNFLPYAQQSNFVAVFQRILEERRKAGRVTIVAGELPTTRADLQKLFGQGNRLAALFDELYNHARILDLSPKASCKTLFKI